MEAELEALRRDREEKLKAIAEKKRQVEELRKKRAERAAKAAPATAPSSDLGKQVDALVAEILGSDGPGAKDKAEEPLKEMAAQAQDMLPIGGKTRAMTTEVGISSAVVLPSEADSYCRAVQTDPVEFTDHVEPMKSPSSGLLAKVAQRARERHVRAGEHTGGGAEASARVPRAASKTGPTEDAAEVEAKIEAMSEEEKERIINSPDFSLFIDKTTRIVERVFGQNTWNETVDFREGKGAQDHGAPQIVHADDYIDERWSQGRAVTDVRFSHTSPEIFLATYNQKEEASLQDPDGCMLVWNLSMKQRPELVFTSQSAVLTARFHKFNDSLFFGGTYSGAIVLWDARARAGPVMRSPLSGKGHSHPVFTVQQVGTQNATGLVTASNDGRLCVWSLAMLNAPQDSIDLKNEARNRRDVPVTCFDFPENETSTLYVGAEDGLVGQCHIHGKPGMGELYQGHDAPVTGLDMHPKGDASQHGVEPAIDFCLTSSFDWSVKLWNVKQHHRPLLSLDNYRDYVYDVRWHPKHPATFATVDGEGHVDLWNLNANMEAPSMRCEHPNRNLALNKCSWSCDGKHLVAGDLEGGLQVYGVDHRVWRPRTEDYVTFHDKTKALHPVSSKTSSSYRTSPVT